MVMKLTASNLLLQSADAPAVILLRKCSIFYAIHALSPTKPCLTLPENTTISYAQLLCFILYARGGQTHGRPQGRARGGP